MQPIVAVNTSDCFIPRPRLLAPGHLHLPSQRPSSCSVHPSTTAAEVAQRLDAKLGKTAFERIISNKDRRYKIWAQELELAGPGYCPTVQRYWKRGTMKPGNLKKFNPNHYPVFENYKIRNWLRYRNKEKKAFLMDILQYKDCELRQRTEGIVFEHMGFDVSGFEIQSPYTPIGKFRFQSESRSGIQDPNAAISYLEPEPPSPLVVQDSFWNSVPTDGFGNNLKDPVSTFSEDADLPSPRSEFIMPSFNSIPVQEKQSGTDRWASFVTLKEDFSFFQVLTQKEQNQQNQKPFPFTESTTAGDMQTPSGSPFPKLEEVIAERDAPDDIQSPTSPRESCELEAQDTVDERFFTLRSRSRHRISPSPSPEPAERESMDPSSDWPASRSQMVSQNGFVMSTARRIIKTPLPKSRVSMKNPRICRIVTNQARPSALLEGPTNSHQRPSLQYIAARGSGEVDLASSRLIEGQRQITEVIQQHRTGKEKSARLSRIGADLSKKLGSAEYWPAFLGENQQQLLVSGERSGKASPGLISVFQSKDSEFKDETSKDKPRIVGIMKNHLSNSGNNARFSVRGQKTLRYGEGDHRGTVTELSSPVRTKITIGSDKLS